MQERKHCNHAVARQGWLLGTPDELAADSLEAKMRRAVSHRWWDPTTGQDVVTQHKICSAAA